MVKPKTIPNMSKYLLLWQHHNSPCEQYMSHLNIRWCKYFIILCPRYKLTFTCIFLLENHLRGCNFLFTVIYTCKFVKMASGVGNEEPTSQPELHSKGEDIETSGKREINGEKVRSAFN